MGLTVWRAVVRLKTSHTYSSDPQVRMERSAAHFGVQVLPMPPGEPLLADVLSHAASRGDTAPAAPARP